MIVLKSPIGDDRRMMLFLSLEDLDALRRCEGEGGIHVETPIADIMLMCSGPAATAERDVRVRLATLRATARRLRGKGTEVVRVADALDGHAWREEGPIPPGSKVHALRSGYALCGAGMPRDFAVGDRWVSGAAATGLEDVTCIRCRCALAGQGAGGKA